MYSFFIIYLFPLCVHRLIDKLRSLCFVCVALMLLLMISLLLWQQWTLTFLSGDFAAKTGMWEASSGHKNGAMVFPSSSPYNQPGEFSSPEKKKKGIIFNFSLRWHQHDVIVVYQLILFVCMLYLSTAIHITTTVEPSWKMFLQNTSKPR